MGGNQFFAEYRGVSGLMLEEFMARVWDGKLFYYIQLVYKLLPAVIIMIDFDRFCF